MWILQCHLIARHYICELCNAILLQGIMYVNYAMPCCLAKHHICELYHAILFLYHVFHLSTMFLYSTTLPVHQPFELVMGKSGVKTRSSEQTMLPAEADILRVIDSSSKEDSETDDRSYFPPEVYAQTWQGYITHIMHILSCNASFLHHIHYIECHLLSLDIIYAIAICLLA